MYSENTKSAKLAYLKALRAGDIPEEKQATFIFSKNEEGISLGFLGSSEMDFELAEAERLFAINLKLEELYQNTNDWKMPEAEEEQQEKLIELGIEFIECVEGKIGQPLRPSRFEEIIESGFNVNFVHPKKGISVIHCLARGASERLTKAFLKADNIDFLLKTVGSQETASMIARRSPVGGSWYKFWCQREQRQAKRDDIDWAEYTKDWHDPFAPK